jgi:L-rhamnose mutarotase
MVKNQGYIQPPEKKVTRRICLTLKLKNDPSLIKEYEFWHREENIWKEIPQGIRDVGIIDMEIYRHERILFMILTVPEKFDFDQQMGKLRLLPRQQEWEVFMENYQDSTPGAASAEKWQSTERIFKLPH